MELNDFKLNLLSAQVQQDLFLPPNPKPWPWCSASHAQPSASTFLSDWSHTVRDNWERWGRQALPREDESVPHWVRGGKLEVVEVDEQSFIDVFAFFGWQWRTSDTYDLWFCLFWSRLLTFAVFCILTFWHWGAREDKWGCCRDRFRRLVIV